MVWEKTFNFQISGVRTVIGLTTLSALRPEGLNAHTFSLAETRGREPILRSSLTNNYVLSVAVPDSYARKGVEEVCTTKVKG